MDRSLLQLAQDEFPLSKRPWDELAERINITHEEALSRAKRLHEEGVIRRISPVLETREVGLRASTLILMKVPRQRVEEVAGIINKYDAVTHNYEREHDYNIWFTLTTSSEGELLRILDEIRESVGIPDSDILNLPVTRRFKIGVSFKFKRTGGR
ncbi:MAG: Lrp/AsnC family transcriptional regulator [Candidatus Bathyarchaeia archaeon]